jgi:two-component system osmolarity sensor histidine kinase EnvZ
MRFLNFLVPRTLRARLILLVLGAVLLAQASTLAALSYMRDKFLHEVAIDYVATTIRTLRAALAQVPGDERADFVRVASQGQWHLWSRVLPPEALLQRRPDRRWHEHEPPPPPPEFDDLRESMREPVRELNRRLADGTRVALSRGPRPELFISLAPDPAFEDAPMLREWLVIPIERLNPAISPPLVAIWLGGLGLVLLISVGFSWHITRPMTRLSEAADRLAAGKPQRVEPAGPHEIRLLGERFNAMLDALAESDSVRRTLLAGLPHDIKGPLSRMWLRIEMADDSALKEGLRKDLQDMQHMVDQFIGFVRGTDPAAYSFAPLDLPEWLSDRVGAWRDAGTDISLALPEDTPMTINGDAVALGRLLDNLVRNALHHGAPPIDVALRREDGKAVLDVADHGPGIAPERRQEALRPFARLDDARTRTGNVGLGLALAEAIVHAHRGKLELRAAEGGGLLVRVSLPLA